MKNILSYYDVFIGVGIIIASIVLWIKYNTFSKKRSLRLERDFNSRSRLDSPLYIEREKNFVHTALAAVIFFTLIILYNRFENS